MIFLLFDTDYVRIYFNFWFFLWVWFYCKILMTAYLIPGIGRNTTHLFTPSHNVINQLFINDSSYIKIFKLFTTSRMNSNNIIINAYARSAKALQSINWVWHLAAVSINCHYSSFFLKAILPKLKFWNCHI